MHWSSSRYTGPLSDRNIFCGICIIIVLFFGLRGAGELRERGREATESFYTFSHKIYSKQPREARSLLPHELVARPLASNLTEVPKLFHQSWSGNASTLPAKFERWSRTCRQTHPDWEWVLWTDEDNMNLVWKYAPWFLDTYDSLGEKWPIYRADVARNLYMHIFGGVYADLDLECLQPTETLVEKYGEPGRQAFVGRMGVDDDSIASLPNAWFASTPGHPYWLLPLEFAQDHFNEKGTPESLTGPDAVFETVKAYNEDYSAEEMDNHYAQSSWRHLFRQPTQDMASSEHHTLTVLPFWEIYPYSWQRDGDPYDEYCSTKGEQFNATVCKKLLGTDHWGSHTITYWSHSWGGGEDGHDGAGFDSVSR